MNITTDPVRFGHRLDTLSSQRASDTGCSHNAAPVAGALDARDPVQDAGEQVLQVPVWTDGKVRTLPPPADLPGVGATLTPAEQIDALTQYLLSAYDVAARC